jgi:hypothetical protein
LISLKTWQAVNEVVDSLLFFRAACFFAGGDDDLASTRLRSHADKDPKILNISRKMT